MEELPACALKCLVQASVAANCSITDISCACASDVYNNFATSCVAGACTIREALYTQNQTSALCHVSPYTDRRFVPVIITFFVLTLLIVSLRIVARIVSQAKFWYDDYSNFAAFIAVSIYTLNDISLSKEGFGVDIWAVPQENIDYILTIFFVGSIFDKDARGVILGTLAFVGVFSFVAVFPIIFQCSPVSYAWLHWDGTKEGRCINFRAFVWIATSIGIVLDFSIVFVAWRLVARLQLPLRKKIMVSALFTTGLVIARLPYINQFTAPKNPTIDWVPITIWSALENYIGVICACLPSLPALLRPRSKVPSQINTLQTSSILPLQRSQVVGHGIETMRYTPIYEMQPKFGRETVSH